MTARLLIRLFALSSFLITSSLFATDIVAHRGASHDAPENTLAALRLAWEQGADAVEVDVHLSADGHVVVMHDEEVDRTTDGKGKIARMPLAEIRRLDAGSWKGDRFRGVGVPTLDEALQTMPAERGRIFIEIKSDPAIVPAIAACLRRAEIALSRVTIIAFDREACRRSKERMPEVEVCWLRKIRRRLFVGPWTPGAERMLRGVREAGLDGLDVKAVEAVDASVVRRIREAGFRLYVYTVDDPERARELIRLGVDGLTTNRPAEMKALRDGLE